MHRSWDRARRQSRPPPGSSLLLSSLIFLAWNGAAGAEAVRWSFEGELREFTNGIESIADTPAAWQSAGIEIGSGVDGYIVWESDTPGVLREPGDDAMRYQDAILDFRFSVGPVTIWSPPTPSGEVLIIPSWDQDPGRAGAIFSEAAAATIPYKFNLYLVLFELFDLIDDDSGIVSPALPVIPYQPRDLAPFEFASPISTSLWLISGLPDYGSARIELTSLIAEGSGAVIVPQPRSLLLQVTALVVLAIGRGMHSRLAR